MGARPGIRVTVDNLYVLRSWGDLFRGRKIFVRIDTGRGRGHHRKVRTAGAQSKFGVPLAELKELGRAAKECEATVGGLHAHTGSGNFAVAGWVETARILDRAAAGFPDAVVLNVGGGLGVPDRPRRRAVDLRKLDSALGKFRAARRARELWLEPGRYVVAAAGVLLARVTQTERQGIRAVPRGGDRDELAAAARPLRLVSRDREPHAYR